MNEVNFLNSSEGNNALPLYCVCCLDYGSFPIILLHSLPTKVQRLIINRLTRSNLPQLRSHVCTNYISSIEFNVDPYTTAYFSDSYVKFMLKAKVPDRNWHCPFCKADYSLISGDQVNVLERHLRLHTEIRCCMDCVTILPNSTYSLDCESAYIHDCNKLKCKVGFKTSAQYQQHLKNVHRGKKFFCQDCVSIQLLNLFKELRFFATQKFNLDRHMRSVHADYEISSNSLSLKMNTVPVSDVSLIKNESNEDTHQSNTTVVPSFKEPTRGYFLYLSDSDCHQSPNINASTSVIDSTKNKQSVLELTSATVGSRSISLVADVSLTPCLPSNPDAQLGIGGKTWKENIDIVQSPKSIEFNNVDSC
ncbi:Zinc finger C2H2 type [Schistosoma japonicum]|nr:Zinc finger C2H2 type [Schistosoma japonicum]